MRPLSCCGKNPLGTRMNRYAFSPMVANRTASVTARKRSATESVLPYRFTSQSKARSLVRYIQPWARFSFKRCAHIMGVAVSETTMETAMATDSVTANSRKRRPTMPPIRSRGMNTAISETLMVNTVELTSCAPLSAAVARCPHSPQKNENHQKHQRHRDDQGLLGIVHGGADGDRLIHGHLHIDGMRNGRLNQREHSPETIHGDRKS